MPYVAKFVKPFFAKYVRLLPEIAKFVRPLFGEIWVVVAVNCKIREAFFGRGEIWLHLVVLVKGRPEGNLSVGNCLRLT